VFSPLWGRLSDRIGRRPVLIVSLIGSAIGSLLTGLAGGLAMLYVARVVDGASGATIAVAQAAASDLADKRDRPRLFGLLGAAFALGFVVGPAIGGLAGLVDRRLPFFIAAAMAAANAIATWIRVPETNSPTQERPSPHEPPARRRHWAFLGGAFGSVAAFAGFEATFALIGEDQFSWSQSDIAFVFVGIGIYLAAIQGKLVVGLATRFGSERLLLVGLATVAVGLVATGAAQSRLSLVGALALLVGGYGLVSPSLAVVVASRVGSRSRGGALGEQQAAGALGRVGGPVLVGALYTWTSQLIAYSTAALIACIALGLISRGLRSSTGAPSNRS